MSSEFHLRYLEILRKSRKNVIWSNSENFKHKMPKLKPCCLHVIILTSVKSTPFFFFWGFNHCTNWKKPKSWRYCLVSKKLCRCCKWDYKEKQPKTCKYLHLALFQHRCKPCVRVPGEFRMTPQVHPSIICSLMRHMETIVSRQTNKQTNTAAPMVLLLSEKPAQCSQFAPLIKECSHLKLVLRHRLREGVFCSGLHFGLVEHQSPFFLWLWLFCGRKNPLLMQWQIPNSLIWPWLLEVVLWPPYLSCTLPQTMNNKASRPSSLPLGPCSLKVWRMSPCIESRATLLGSTAGCWTWLWKTLSPGPFLLCQHR